MARDLRFIPAAALAGLFLLLLFPPGLFGIDGFGDSSGGDGEEERTPVVESLIFAEDLSTLTLAVRIPQGYHQTLQKDFFNLQLLDLQGSGDAVLRFGETAYPEGKVDQYGDVQYYGTVELQVPLLFTSSPREGDYAGVLRLNYQLCDEAGTCYLPEFMDIDFNFSVDQSISVETEGQPFLLMLLFAFVGGLLLNVMPCVFPILSIRALNLVKQSSSDKKSIRTGAILYGTGVLATFLVFAIIVLVLKAGGELAGWGFQFQNPGFVLILSALLFVFALSLFDLFIFQPPVLGNRLARAQSKGHLGAFLNGLLAVILATPCTAPFLGSALGFAFSQSGPSIIIFFLAIGAGFALPFVLLGFVPALVKRIPKPGPWMDWFKEIMGLVLIGTSLYFLSIFSTQVSKEELLGALSFLFALASGAWLYGKLAKPGAGRGKKWLALVLFTTIGITSALLFFPGQGGEAVHVQKGPERQSFSPALLSRLRQEEKPVFLVFSAQWCSVCKVNDRRVLDTEAGRELFDTYGVEYLYGDYTREDPLIGEWIKRLGRAGVPVYAFYRPGAENPRLLPELLSLELLEEAFSRGETAGMAVPSGRSDGTSNGTIDMEKQETPATEGLGGMEFFQAPGPIRQPEGG